MTEIEAWKQIGNAWLHAKEDQDGAVRPQGYSDALGLCTCIQVTAPAALQNQMKRRLPDKPIKYQPYCWPLNMAGAAARAEFCFQQAALLEGQAIPKPVIKTRTMADAVAEWILASESAQTLKELENEIVTSIIPDTPKTGSLTKKFYCNNRLYEAIRYASGAVCLMRHSQSEDLSSLPVKNQ